MKGLCYLFGICVLGIFFLFGVVEGAGLAIHPMEQFISPNESTVYYASNQLEKAIAVEVILESWTISEDGEEIREETRDLVAYPAQFILKGNTYKKVKVGLRNPEGNLEHERCYRVTVRELPISLDPEEPGTFRIYQAAAYRTSFYIQPKNPNPKIEVVDASYDEERLTVRLANVGNSHIHLRNPVLVLKTGDGEELEVAEKEILKPMNGENMHAQITRRFIFDFSSVQLPEGIVEAHLSFKDVEALAQDIFTIPWIHKMATSATQNIEEEQEEGEYQNFEEVVSEL